MKRAIVFLAAVLLSLNLCACSGIRQPAVTAPPTETPAEVTLTPAPETPAPTPEATPAPTAEPTPVPTPTQTAAPENLETLEVLRRGGTVSYPAVMTELRLHNGVSCAIMLPTEAMKAEFTENAWRLTDTETGENGFLEFSYIAGTTAEDLLPGLMDGYLDFTDIEFADVSSVGTVRGTIGHVSASDGEWLAEGWVLNADGGVIVLAQVCRLKEMDDLGNLLDAVLDSFTLVAG